MKTAQQIKDDITSLLADNSTQDISPEDIRDVCTSLADLAGAGDYDSLNIEWDVATTYAIDDIVSYLERLWKSKSAGNLGNQPPSDPNTTEDTYWIEQSKAPAGPITEWQAGVYGAGLIIVYYNDNFYKLENSTRPFVSTNINTEFLNGDWSKVSGDILYEDAVGNTAVELLKIQRTTSGVPAAGIGASIGFYSEVTAGEGKIGEIVFTANDVGADERGGLSLNLMDFDAGTMKPALNIDFNDSKFSIGRQTEVAAVGAIVLGYGPFSKLVNNRTNSLGIGWNETFPALWIEQDKANTTDATLAILKTILLDPSSTYHVHVRVIGGETDGSPTERAMYTMEGLFYRIGSGNVVQQGATNYITAIESTGSMDCIFVTGASTVLVKAIGVAATNMNWRTIVTISKVESN